MKFGPFERLGNCPLAVQSPGGVIVPHGMLEAWSREIYQLVSDSPEAFLEHRWFFRIRSEPDESPAEFSFLIALNPYADAAHSCLLYLCQISGSPLPLKSIGRPQSFHDAHGVAF